MRFDRKNRSILMIHVWIMDHNAGKRKIGTSISRENSTLRILPYLYYSEQVLPASQTGGCTSKSCLHPGRRPFFTLDTLFLSPTITQIRPYFPPTPSTSTAMVGLSATHHSFLQSMMTCGALSTDDTKKLYNKCVQKDRGSRAAEVHDVDDLRRQIYIINK